MEKAWEVVHKPFRSLCVQGGIIVGEGARTAGCDSCLTLLDVCQRFWRELCLGDLSSLYAMDVQYYNSSKVKAPPWHSHSLFPLLYLGL